MNNSMERSANPKRRQNPSLLSDHILSIIDSKVQYMNEEMNLAILKVDAVGIGSLNIEQKERMLKNLEFQGRTVRLLYFLRSILNFKNVDVMFELLSDNKFLDFTEESLRTHFANGTLEALLNYKSN